MNLPVLYIVPDLLKAMKSHPAVVVTAPTGSGKSTGLPLELLKAMGPSGKILMLEPRRVAARAIASRMANMLGERVGETIGYRVRKDSKVSGKTRLEVVTEGVLTRMLIADATLDGYDVVIFDEVHERSLNTDVALALTRETQRVLRDDLRIVLMSATIDAMSICDALHAPLIQAEGRMYSVDIRHIDGDMVHAIYTALHETVGDILCFLPGEAEILRTKEALSNVSAVVRPLYGRLSPEEQDLAISTEKNGQRKIILSTNIAETSLTIEGVRVVIDSGLCRVAVFDPRTGMSHLENQTISLDMAAQRSGRAGRTAEGICYRLWPLAAEHKMHETRVPEIVDADLSGMVLDIAAWGGKVSDLQWLTTPPPAHVAQATDLLRLLGAVDERGVITHLGRRMNALPYHPRLQKMMCIADDRKLATHIAEVLEEGRGAIPHTCEAGKLIASAYPERIAIKVHDCQYRTASGVNACVDSDNPLIAEPWLAIADINMQTGHVFTAAPLHIEDVDTVYTRHSLAYDRERRMVVASEERRVGQLVISRKNIHDVPEEEKLACVIEAVRRDGLSIFSWSEDDIVRLQQRVNALRQWHPEMDIPDLSAEAAMAHPEDWIITSDLRQFDLYNALLSLLTYEQQQTLDRLAPSHIAMPSGHRIRLDYRPAAEAPVLSVRLQECFGMMDTPRVDGGQRPVLMELLSPGFKPVQLTSDLRSFWTGTYFEVRKELRRRYPKHAWPEDPSVFL